MAKSKIAPLPVDPAGRIQPLNSVVAESPIQPVSSPEPTVTERDDRDDAQKWLDDNPNFDETIKSSPSQERVDETPVAAETPAEKPSPDAKPHSETPPPPPTGDKPAEVPPAAIAAEKPAEVAAPPKPTYAPEEKIALAEGVDWTRAQVVAALQERATLQPAAAEAEGYKKLFGMTAQDAQQAWGPIVQRLATEPATVAFLDAYLANPEMAQYLESCARFYNQETGAPAPAPASNVAAPPQRAAAQNDPLAREVAELRQWRQTQETESATRRVQSEMAQVTQRYPFLANDRALIEDLMTTGQALNARDPSKGILDALAMKAPLYDAVMNARAQQPAGDPAPPQAPQAMQPALLGSPGASPNGSRPASNSRAKTFDTLDDAVDNWLTNPPRSFE